MSDLNCRHTLTGNDATCKPVSGFLAGPADREKTVLVEAISTTHFDGDQEELRFNLTALL